MTNNNRAINQIIEAMGINNKAEHVKIAWVHCLSNYDEKTLTDMLQMLYIQRRSLIGKKGLA